MPKAGETLHTITATYTIEKNIGNGGAGSVYKAIDEYGAEYAIKILTANASTKKRRRFVQELKYCENTSNPSIVKVLDSGLYIPPNGSNQPFYVMPLYGHSLRYYIENDSSVEPPDFFALFLKLLRGIQQFHAEGNVHRDIKPENILVTVDESSLVLADFGIAHVSESYPGATVVTVKDERLANFRYASPEQRDQFSTIDNRSDIFSLALILVELFTGEIPYGTGFTTVGQLWDEYAFLDDIVEKMLAQNRGDRYADLSLVLADIQARATENAALQTVNEALKSAEAAIVSDYDIRITNMQWQNGNVVITLNDQPDDLWIACFQSHPKDSFDTSGYRFGPKYWIPKDGEILIRDVGKNAHRVSEIKNQLPGFVVWTNQQASTEKAHREKEACDQRIALARQEYERARAEADAESEMNVILNGTVETAGKEPSSVGFEQRSNGNWALRIPN